MQKSEKNDGAEATVDVQFTDLPNALIACKVTEDVFNDQTLKVRMCVMVDQSIQPKQACITLQWFPTIQLKPICVCVCARACMLSEVSPAWENRCNWMWEKRNLVVSLAQLDQTIFSSPFPPQTTVCKVPPQVCYYCFDHVGINDRGDVDDRLMITRWNQPSFDSIKAPLPLHVLSGQNQFSRTKRKNMPH